MMAPEAYRLLSGTDVEQIVAATLQYLRPEMRAIGLSFDRADRMADAVDRSVTAALTHVELDLRVRWDR